MQIRVMELSYLPQSKPLQRVPLEGHNILWEAPSADTRWSDPLVRQLRHLPTEKLELGGALTALAGAGMAVGLGLEGHSTAALLVGGIAGLGALSVAAARTLDSALAELQPRAARNLEADLRRSRVIHETTLSLRSSNQPVQHHTFNKAEVLQAGDCMLLSFPETGRWVVVDPSREVPVQQYRADGSQLLANWTSDYPITRFQLDPASGTLSAASSDKSRRARIDLNTGQAELYGPRYRTSIDADGKVQNPPGLTCGQLGYSHEGLVTRFDPKKSTYHLEPVPFDLESFGYKVELPSGSDR